MKRNNSIFLLCIVACFPIFFLISCNNNSQDNCRNQIDISKIEGKIQVIRFEEELFAKKDTTQIKKLLEKYPQLTQKFYRINTKEIPQKFLKAQEFMVNDKYLDTVYKDCKAHFGDFKDIENEFLNAFKHIKYYFPNFKFPTIYTTITGLKSFGGTEFYVDKDIIVISLDFFLGKKSRYRPKTDEYPDYVWKDFHKKSIVPFCLFFIGNAYNQSNLTDKTVIADMIYYGKTLEFVKRAMPCLPDSVILRYTNEEMMNVEDKANRNFLWNHLIEKKVLFSNSETTKKTYLGDRPYIAEVNKKCPARIGQLFGWRIIQKYLKKNSQISFPDLMKNQDAQVIFDQAAYNGQ
jgi:hypothetical protein